MELSQCSLRCFLAVDFSQKYGKIRHGGGDSYAEGEEPPFPAPKFNSEALKKEVMFWQAAGIAKLIVILVATNGAWIWYCNQWETIYQEVTQEADTGTNNFVGGDVIGETDYQNP